MREVSWRWITAKATAVAAEFRAGEDREDEPTAANLGGGPSAAGEAVPLRRSLPRWRRFPPTASTASPVFRPPKKHLPKLDPSSSSHSTSPSSPPLTIPHETKLQLLQESKEKRGLQLNLRGRERNSGRKQTRGGDPAAGGGRNEGDTEENIGAAEGRGRGAGFAERTVHGAPFPKNVLRLACDKKVRCKEATKKDRQQSSPPSSRGNRRRGA